MQKPLPNETASPARSTITRTIMFRFAFVYWMLIVFVVASNEDTGLTLIGKLVTPMWNPIVVWVGKHVLSISYQLDTAINGSGDKTTDWVGVFVSAATAVVATVVWCLIDRRGAQHVRLRSLLRVIMRYTVAFALLGYGSSKLFLLQFPSPSAGRLLQSYGESSPAGLLWTFMGVSPVYAFIAGAAETIGAVLLLFRCTTVLGAFILAVVLVNVVQLNFCYDIPIKINSVHYLGMCIFLLLPTLRVLADLVIFRRAAQPVELDPMSTNRRPRFAGLALKYALIGVMVFYDVWTDLDRWVARSAKTWYSDSWNVTKFTRDGQEIPALISDATRWKRIRFEIGRDRSYARWRFMDGTYGDLYVAVVDEKLQMMTFTASDLDERKSSPSPVNLRYVRTDPDHLTLEGKIGVSALSVQVERLNADKMPLMSRGFHWINERPFFR
jgi:uncharacterized membrane protein YphA (DoxX/SURF4 family)